MNRLRVVEGDGAPPDQAHHYATPRGKKPSHLLTARRRPNVLRHGNPGGSPEATRRAFNKRFLLDLAEDWQQHGREVFKRVRRESPAAYLKVCAMLVPREMKVEHSAAAAIKELTDEQLDQAIAAVKDFIARQSGEMAKVIDGEAEVVPSLPAPGTPATAS